MDVFLAFRRLRLHPHVMFIYQLASQHGCQREYQRRQQREAQTPGLNPALHIAAEAQQPVKGCQRQGQNGQQGVTPGSDQSANGSHRQQIQQPDGTRHPTAQSAYAHQPKTGTRPKGITSEDKSQIGGHQSQQGGHGKVNQQMMQEMKADGHAGEDSGTRDSSVTRKWWTGSCMVTTSLTRIALMMSTAVIAT